MFCGALIVIPSGVCGRLDLGEHLESLLSAFGVSIGSHEQGVPREILHTAVMISAAAASVQQAGPSDAVADDDQDGVDVENASASAADECAAAVDGGVDDLSPLQLWDAIMKKYKVAQECDSTLARLDAKTEKDERDRVQRERSLAVAAAVAALARLKHAEVQQKLRDFQEQEKGRTPSIRLSHADTPLSNFDPQFWACCFVDLFCRGDCQERIGQGQRRTHVPTYRWAKCLITRADFREWRMDFEFVACLYNILLRRSQLRAVQMTMKNIVFSPADAEALQQTTSQDLMAHALASGDCDSVRQVLRRKQLEPKLRKTFEYMQIAQRKVRGSEAERDTLHFKFRAMRIWHGCSSLFFTLNPHDIRSPLTLTLLNSEHFHSERFSLDLPDDATEDYLKTLLGDNPRRLHEMAAQDPVAATKCFHYTVRLVLDALFNCSRYKEPFPDGVPARVVPGVFGHVAGYLGVVEPQMRKALHIHMLVQLLGFAHPLDLFGHGRMQDVVRRCWYFAASICFRSTEAFSHYLNEPHAARVLRSEPLLPVTKKQRLLVGEERAAESLRQQLQARGLSAPPDTTELRAPLRFFVPHAYGDECLPSGTWAATAVRDVSTATARTGNHVCRKDVCYKGRIGKKGFCRMLFWHWAKVVKDTGEVGAVRRHGLPLQQRWDGSGWPPVLTSPPFRGTPALEMTHPFHFKMSPAMLLGPRCNHDLGLLLRLPDVCDVTEDNVQHCVDAMVDTMGAHEHYCASYAAKEQPHIEGLLQTLADGKRSLEAQMAREAKVDDSVEDARRLLHRLLSATNRRMHKGFPEMISYLLGKPTAYCSHDFAHLPFEFLLKRLYAQIVTFAEGDADATFTTGPASYAAVSPVPGAKLRLSPSDYNYRPSALEKFPLFFSLLDARRRRRSRCRGFYLRMTFSSRQSAPFRK